MDKLKTASMDASFGTFVRKPSKRATSDSARSNVPEQASPTVAATSNATDEWVEVGVIGDAYGVVGWLKIYPHAQASQGGGALLQVKRWQLTKNGQTQNVTVSHAKLHGGNHLVAQLAGCTNRDAAEAFKGWHISVSRTDFPALAADEYYWVDLIGLEVVTEAGMALGQVTGLLESSAHAILRIASSELDKKGAQVERLIPFVAAHVTDVDFGKRQIVVNWEEEI